MTFIENFYIVALFFPVWVKEKDLPVNFFLALFLVGTPFSPSYDLSFPRW